MKILVISTILGGGGEGGVGGVYVSKLMYYTSWFALSELITLYFSYTSDGVANDLFLPKSIAPSLTRLTILKVNELWAAYALDNAGKTECTV